MVDKPGNAEQAPVNEILLLPIDGPGWQLRAQSLANERNFDAALDASSRALALWPSVQPVHELRLRLAKEAGDLQLEIESLRNILAVNPDDAWLSSELGAKLSEAGDFVAALPFLRVAAPIMLHENCSIWNYTAALAVTGGYHELLAAQPLLDRFAPEVTQAFPPYGHLAAAKLSLHIDRDLLIRTVVEREAGSPPLDTEQVARRLKAVIETGRPFSLIRLEHGLARFVSYTSLYANLLLRPQELIAVVDEVWREWFETAISEVSMSSIAALSTQFRTAVIRADILAAPNTHILRNDNYHFGFLAEMYRSLLASHQQAFASMDVVPQLHDMMPFLLQILNGLPFLGFVGHQPGLVDRLARFCGVARGEAVMTTMKPKFPEEYTRVAAEITVPFQGAVFLIATPGPVAALYCERVKNLGGIAIDISSLADLWAQH